MKKKVTKKKAPVKEISPEKALVHNSIALQKVVVDIGRKFDKLSGEIEKLLQLFELSAKTLAEKEVDLTTKKKQYKEIIDKIDNLFEQNKVLARGVTLEQGKRLPELKIPKLPPRPNMQQQVPQQAQEQQPTNTNGYQKSIISQDKKFKPLPK